MPRVYTVLSVRISPRVVLQSDVLARQPGSSPTGPYFFVDRTKCASLFISPLGRTTPTLVRGAGGKIGIEHLIMNQLKFEVCITNNLYLHLDNFCSTTYIGVTKLCRHKVEFEYTKCLSL